MTARAPTKPKPATWLDLMPAGFPLPELLSHDQLLERLQERGVDLSSSALEYYRNRHILPRPVRRWHEGRTQPTYARWLVPVIETLKDMQARGMSLDEIRDKLPVVMQMHIANTVQWRDGDLDTAIAALDVALREYARVMHPWLADRGTVTSIRVALRDDEQEEELDYHDLAYAPE